MTLRDELWSRTSDVRYAHVGEAHVAYRVIAGDAHSGHEVVLLLGGTASMEALFEDPVCVRFVDGLARLGRLVLFDRRGIGLSDPPEHAESSYETRWSDDIEAVLAAAKVARAVVVSGTSSWTASVVYCDRHPDQVAAVVSLEPSPPSRWPRDIVRRQIEGELDSVTLFCPSRADDPGFREWFTRAGRVGASPTRAATAYPSWTEDEAREIARASARITAPTLVLRRPAARYSPPASSDPVATVVPGAVRVDVPGEDLMYYGGEVDALLAEISHFVTGEYRLPAPECALASVLFSDVVASTEQVTALGGARWKLLLDRHDEVARTCVGRRGGTVVNTTGDGILATLPSAIGAIRAGQELRTALGAEGLDVRIGIHVGDVDRRGDDISGLAVHIAARIMHLAAPGEILASRALRDLVAGTAVSFFARGEHTLKGVPDTWELFAVAPA